MGIQLRQWILESWGQAGSDLYVSFAFVAVLVTIGGYVFRDAHAASRSGAEPRTPPPALKPQAIRLRPMIHFKIVSPSLLSLFDGRFLL